MSKGNVYWAGNVYITYKDVELNVYVNASGTYYYSPGCMYRRNGDPGDPPEEETEVTSIDIEHIFITGIDDDDDVDILKWLKPEVIKEIEELCQEAIEEGQLDMQADEPDYDDYEPEPEDY